MPLADWTNIFSNVQARLQLTETFLQRWDAKLCMTATKGFFTNKVSVKMNSLLLTKLRNSMCIKV